MTSLTTRTCSGTIRHVFTNLPTTTGTTIAIRANVRNHDRILTKAAYGTSTVRLYNKTNHLRQPCSHKGTDTDGNKCPRRQTQAAAPTVMSMSRKPQAHQPSGRKAMYSTEASNQRTDPAPSGVQQPSIHPVFQDQTGTWQYVVADPDTKKAVIIDPVLDYDPSTQTASTTSADALLALVKDQSYHVEMILETHAHADHPTAATYLRTRLTSQEQGSTTPKIGIGKRINQVQDLFGEKYGVPTLEYQDVFDKLFEDDEIFKIGNMTVQAIHLPGHTPDHLGYKIGDNMFCGDSIFHADIGTARCDFPGGSAYDLYRSTQKLLSMEDDVKIWTGHDYPPENRASPQPYMTVLQHKTQNRHLKDDVSEDDFVAMRRERDAQLGEPRLLHQSLQMNIRAGRLPGSTPFGQKLLHLPLKLKVKEW